MWLAGDTALPIGKWVTCEVEVWHWINSEWIIRFHQVRQAFCFFRNFWQFNFLNPCHRFQPTLGYLWYHGAVHSLLGFTASKILASSRYSSMNTQFLESQWLSSQLLKIETPQLLHYRSAGKVIMFFIASFKEEEYRQKGDLPLVDLP